MLAPASFCTSLPPDNALIIYEIQRLCSLGISLYSCTWRSVCLQPPRGKGLLTAESRKVVKVAAPLLTAFVHQCGQYVYFARPDSRVFGEYVT